MKSRLISICFENRLSGRYGVLNLLRAAPNKFVSPYRIFVIRGAPQGHVNFSIKWGYDEERKHLACTSATKMVAFPKILRRYLITIFHQCVHEHRLKSVKTCSAIIRSVVPAARRHPDSYHRFCTSAPTGGASAKGPASGWPTGTIPLISNENSAGTAKAPTSVKRSLTTRT